MSKTFSRALALVLCLCMVVSLLPAAVFADAVAAKITAIEIKSGEETVKTATISKSSADFEDLKGTACDNRVTIDYVDGDITLALPEGNDAALTFKVATTRPANLDSGDSSITLEPGKETTVYIKAAGTDGGADRYTKLLITMNAADNDASIKTYAVDNADPIEAPAGNEKELSAGEIKIELPYSKVATIPAITLTVAQYTKVAVSKNTNAYGSTYDDPKAAVANTEAKTYEVKLEDLGSLEDGKATKYLKVTAQDGTTTLYYKLSFTMAGAKEGADITSITVVAADDEIPYKDDAKGSAPEKDKPADKDFLEGLDEIELAEVPYSSIGTLVSIALEVSEGAEVAYVDDPAESFVEADADEDGVVTFEVGELNYEVKGEAPEVTIENSVTVYVKVTSQDEKTSNYYKLVVTMGKPSDKIEITAIADGDYVPAEDPTKDEGPRFTVDSIVGPIARPEREDSQPSAPTTATMAFNSEGVAVGSLKVTVTPTASYVGYAVEDADTDPSKISYTEADKYDEDGVATLSSIADEVEYDAPEITPVLIYIKVVAEDKTTTKYYKLQITMEEPSHAAELLTMKVGEYTAEPGAKDKEGVKHWTVSLPTNDKTELTGAEVEITISDLAKAEFENGDPFVEGDKEGVLTATYDAEKNIVVTAQDEDTVSEHAIDVVTTIVCIDEVETSVEAGKLPEALVKVLGAADAATYEGSLEATTVDGLKGALSEVVSELAAKYPAKDLPDLIESKGVTVVDVNKVYIHVIPTVKVNVDSYSDDPKELTVSFTVTYDVVAATVDNGTLEILPEDEDEIQEGKTYNAVVLTTGETLDVTTKVTVSKLPLPTGFTEESSVYVTQDGVEYQGAVTDGVSFEVEGLSTVVITTDTTAFAKIGDNVYKSLQEAVDAVANNDVIELQAAAADEGAVLTAVAPEKSPLVFKITPEALAAKVKITAPAGYIVDGPDAKGNVIVSKDEDYVPEPEPDHKDECPAGAFTDYGDIHSEGDPWIAPAVHFVMENGLMKGEKTDYFNVNGNVSRAMVATVLHRMAGEEAATKEADFTDTKGHWAADAIAWAAEKGIVTGRSAEIFDPDANVTRQELVVMLWRYAEKPAPAGDAETVLKGFDDVDNIWAEDAIVWAVEQEILKGTSANTIEPDGTATRAQFAAYIQRYLEPAAE